MPASVPTSKMILLSRAIPIEQQDEIIQWLEETDGIISAKYHEKKCNLTVKHDLLSISYHQILNILVTNGFLIRKGLFISMLTSWYNFLDRTASSNARGPVPSCCSKPGRKK